MTVPPSPSTCVVIDVYDVGRRTGRLEGRVSEFVTATVNCDVVALAAFDSAVVVDALNLRDMLGAR